MKCSGHKLSSSRLAKLALAIAAALPGTSQAEAGDAALARRAMHLLRDHCVRCHNTKKTKGDLNLTGRELALKGGGEGPAFLPGQAAESHMFQFLHPDSDPHMPRSEERREGKECRSRWSPYH